MSDPLTLFPFAMAAGGGRIDDFECRQLVAAGVTLLQRSAGLVRALAGRRSALLLPTGAAWMVALAASDGRGAVLMDPGLSDTLITRHLTAANVGAVFTVASLASGVPHEMPTVLLDDAPRSARVIIDGIAREVDLGSHHGIALEGSRDVDGRDEECLLAFDLADAASGLRTWTHAQLIRAARDAARLHALTSRSHTVLSTDTPTVDVLCTQVAATLMCGGRVTTPR